MKGRARFLLDHSQQAGIRLGVFAGGWQNNTHILPCFIIAKGDIAPIGAAEGIDDFVKNPRQRGVDLHIPNGLMHFQFVLADDVQHAL